MEIPKKPTGIPMPKTDTVDPWDPTDDPDEMLTKLKDANFHPPPHGFRVGDKITPKKDSNQKGIGRPMEVLEVFEESRYIFPAPGNRVVPVDIVIGLLLGDNVFMYQVRSDDYEKYTVLS